jgi:hypothetical protein
LKELAKVESITPQCAIERVMNIKLNSSRDILIALEMIRLLYKNKHIIQYPFPIGLK